MRGELGDEADAKDRMDTEGGEHRAEAGEKGRVVRDGASGSMRRGPIGELSP